MRWLCRWLLRRVYLPKIWRPDDEWRPDTLTNADLDALTDRLDQLPLELGDLPRERVGLPLHPRPAEYPGAVR